MINGAGLERVTYEEKAGKSGQRYGVFRFNDLLRGRPSSVGTLVAKLQRQCKNYYSVRLLQYPGFLECAMTATICTRSPRMV